MRKSKFVLAVLQNIKEKIVHLKYASRNLQKIRLRSNKQPNTCDLTSFHKVNKHKQGQGKQKRVIIQKTCIGKALYAAAP